jgi:hypothetical protein
LEHDNPYEELADLWREFKQPFLPFWRFLGSHGPTSESAPQRSNLWRYVDNPWTTAAIGILAGAMFQIIAVAWAFVLSWVLFSLALIRVQSSDGSARGVKALRFILVSGVIGLLLWAGSRIMPKPQPPAKLPTASEIAVEVSKLWPKVSGQAETAKITKMTHGTIPEVSLIFKESALLTPERKQRITEEINNFYLYLKGLGFPVQKEVPPLGVSASNFQAMSGVFPGTIYDQHILLPKNSLDNLDAIRKVYASYVFRTLFGTFGPNSLESQDRANDEITAALYEVYYASSAVNRDLDSNNDWRGHVWMEALWEIRQKMGKDFTDRAMFYTYKTWDPKPIPGDFEAKFWTRFLAGVWVIDNNGTSIGTVGTILAKHHIRQSS